VESWYRELQSKLFDFEIEGVIAYALLKARIDLILLPAAAQHKFLAARSAPYRYFNTCRTHRFLLIHASSRVSSINHLPYYGR